MPSTTAVTPPLSGHGESSAQPRTALLPPTDLSPRDRSQWRELLVAHPASASFLNEAWVTAWTAAFKPLRPLFACAWDTGRLAGIGALQGLTESWNGQRTRVLQSLTNVESFRYEFVADTTATYERLWRTICDLRQWDVVRIENLPEDSETLRAGVRVARALGWTPFVDLAFESPWRPLPRSGSPWDEGLKRKFKANLRNRERRLQALGEVTFSVAHAGAEQRAALDVFYSLEASGWKGERGTAIGQRPTAKAFYDGLQSQGASEIWISILSVAGRPAAAQLIRVWDSTLFLLKTAYDPVFAPYAPGQLITARLIRYGMDHDMEILDFLGWDMTWKRDWEPQLRRHYCLQLFAPSKRGRYAYWSRYGIRERVKKIPGARRLARWLHFLRAARDRDAG